MDPVLPNDAIRVRDADGARWLTIERPPLNVLDVATLGALARAIEPLTARRDLKVLVLRSGVEEVFSAGMDVADHAPDRAPAMLDAAGRLFRLLDELPQVTLAAVDGLCLGGGCELAAFCDVALATARSRFGLPEIDVGCFPPVAAALFPRLVGRRAFELVLGGGQITAAEAARAGLVNRVVESLESETGAWVVRLADKSGAALALARRAVRRGGEGPLLEALGRTEALYREELLATADAEEGVRAFLEKRAPRWRDG